MGELNGSAADLDQIQPLALTNYGHFTSMRVDDRRVRGLSLHLERLRRDCRELFDVELDLDHVRYLVRHALNDAPCSVVLRVTVFDPALELGHPGADAAPRTLITTRAAARTPPAPLRLRSAHYCREMPEVKHVGLFGSLRHRRLAQREGFDDALFTDAAGMISEAATSNIGFIAGDRVVWPAADCLPGVTMRLLNEVRRERATTSGLTLADAVGMDAVFATNAAVGVRPVSGIDDERWPEEHPVLELLREEYARIPAERV